MRVLVTGGAGFIGSHVVEQLAAGGATVAVLDDLSRGSLANLPPGVSLYHGDIRDKVFVRETLEHFRPRVVVHQAAQVDVRTSLDDPARDAAVNIEGTIHLLEACRQAGVEKVVYASSAAVYGDPLYLPVDEGHPVRPLAGYGISKHTVEHYLQVYRALYGLDYTVLRYANVYGPRQDATGEGGVVAVFTRRLLRGEDPCVYGDGEQTRDFVYVGDVAAANLAALRKGGGQVLNVSTGRATTVNELLRLLQGITGAKIKARYCPPRPGDIRHSYLACDLAQKILGWRARTDLATGLKLTVEWYRHSLSPDRSG
ncbi:MAG: UDP-glucose 4-epimerase [Thermoanaerobacter sp.]|jgi:UDP-glucose 4-epimerase|uniref:SDR family oxidoreductase n=1 Tax=Desulfofundulus thermocisternus TaxID=42471 RepID=UPI000484A769|nr:SDR family oxidoreductase [Desulfofundulus thermocisternus]MDK2888474.1 UDP-glucose 4-epimerase [Thermoanaerobacter sp.]